MARDPSLATPGLEPGVNAPGSVTPGSFTPGSFVKNSNVQKNSDHGLDFLFTLNWPYFNWFSTGGSRPVSGPSFQ